jgi:hypothetical protein
LEINEKLWNAKLMENDLRWQYRIKQKTTPGQLSLFNTPAPPPPDQPVDRPAKEEIGDEIFKMFCGKTMRLREIYRALADEPYFAREVKSALAHLHRQGRVIYSGELRNDTSLTFKSK